MKQVLLYLTGCARGSSGAPASKLVGLVRCMRCTCPARWRGAA